MKSDRFLIWVFAIICCVIVVTFFAVAQISYEIGAFQEDIMNDIGEFKEMTNGAWSTMQKSGRGSFISSQMFRQKRQPHYQQPSNSFVENSPQQQFQECTDFNRVLDLSCAVGLPGPVGPAGDDGFNGIPGIDGKAGVSPNNLEEENITAECIKCEAGPPGVSGPDGPPGPAGPAGNRGIDTYGRRGPPGPPGQPGPSGNPGRDGIPGRDGQPGSPAFRKINKPGRTGPRGPIGRPGAAGKNAPRTQGRPGPSGPSGPAGKPGQRGMDGRMGIPGPNGRPGDDKDYCPCPKRIFHLAARSKKSDRSRR